jgi:hypothetical protein
LPASEGGAVNRHQNSANAAMATKATIRLGSHLGTLFLLLFVGVNIRIKPNPGPKLLVWRHQTESIADEGKKA